MPTKATTATRGAEYSACKCLPTTKPMTAWAAISTTTMPMICNAYASGRTPTTHSPPAMTPAVSVERHTTVTRTECSAMRHVGWTAPNCHVPRALSRVASTAVRPAAAAAAIGTGACSAYEAACAAQGRSMS